jgi:hypothetical protein
MNTRVLTLRQRKEVYLKIASSYTVFISLLQSELHIIVQLRTNPIGSVSDRICTPVYVLNRDSCVP